MKINDLFQKSQTNILETIQTYKKALMNDINLTIRLIYNEKTYSTHLIEWTDTIVIFEAPMEGIQDVLLPKNLPLDVILVSKIALFHTTFSICKNYRQENKLYYVAEITTPIEKRQQREAFRLDVTLDVQYDLLVSGGQSLETPVSGNGICLNISLGGMCLVSDYQFHSKDQLQLSFVLNEVSLTFLGEILYLGEKTEQDNYSHRIRFLDLDAADTNLLNRLIFEKQRLQLKRP